MLHALEVDPAPDNFQNAKLRHSGPIRIKRNIPFVNEFVSFVAEIKNFKKPQHLFIYCE